MRGITLYSTLLDRLNELGLGKVVREIYRHSIFSEFYHRFMKICLEDELLVKRILGYQMILDISNGGLEKDLFLHGIREKESTEIFLENLEKGMKVVDIGANIGYYALMEADEVGEPGHVSAIEPTESTFRHLQMNCKINDFENIRLHNKAIGLEKGKVNINKGDSPNLNRVAVDENKGGLIEQESLDDLIDFDPDIVRMDVQGYELEILKGMNRILKSDNLMLFIEVHPSKIERYYDGNIEEFWKILSENNFQIKHLVRHPPRPNISYFIRRDYPPKKVLSGIAFLEYF